MCPPIPIPDGRGASHHRMVVRVSPQLFSVPPFLSLSLSWHLAEGEISRQVPSLPSHAACSSTLCCSLARQSGPRLHQHAMHLHLQHPPLPYEGESHSHPGLHLLLFPRGLLPGPQHLNRHAMHPHPYCRACHWEAIAPRSPPACLHMTHRLLPLPHPCSG